MAVVINGTTGITTPTESVATTIGVGGANPATSGAGITFPAITLASSDPNTLDDYEEGTFSPQLAFGNLFVGMITAQAGFYTKIGNFVFIRILINLTNKGTSTGAATIQNLPFVSNRNKQVCVLGASLLGIVGHVQTYGTNSNILFLEYLGTGAQTAVSDTNFQNSGSALEICGGYNV